MLKKRLRLMLTLAVSTAAAVGLSTAASAAKLYVRSSNLGGQGAIVVVDTATHGTATLANDTGSDSSLSRGLLFGPDGLLYAPHSDGTLDRLHAISGAPQGELDISYPFGGGPPLTFGPDGSIYALTAGTAGVIRRFNGQTGQDLGVFADYPGELDCGTGMSDLAFGPDSNLWTLTQSCGAGGGFRVERFDGKTGALLGTVATLSADSGNPAKAMRFGPRGDLIVSRYSSIERFVPPTASFVTLVGPGSVQGVSDVAFGPDGSLFVALVDQGRVKRFDVATGALIEEVVQVARPEALLFACATAGTTLCAEAGRLRVEESWQTGDGRQGFGQPIQLTSETGYFWFFSETNVESVVKVLNACTPPFNRHWVFASGLTDVKVTLRVTDSTTGEVKTYGNPLGHLFQPIADTGAFATCP